MLREAATLGKPAGLRTTTSNVESSALTNILFTTCSNISLVYRINRRGPSTVSNATPKIIWLPHSQHHQPRLCLRSERNSVQMYGTLPHTPIDFNLKRPLWLTSVGCTKVELNQGLLQHQSWVSTNGVLKDCMIKYYLGYRILIKYYNYWRKKWINRTPLCWHPGLELQNPLAERCKTPSLHLRTSEDEIWC